MATLVTHFQAVVAGLGDGSWKHYAREGRRPRRTSQESKVGGSASRKYNWSKSDLDAKLVFDDAPALFYLQPRLLRARISMIRQKVVDSFYSFNFEHYSPRLLEIFGEDCVGVADSGISSLFPRRPRGRPRATRLASNITLRKKADSKHAPAGSLPLPADYSSSSALPSVPHRITDILFQAMDTESKRLYVFLEWKNTDAMDCCWAKLSSLSDETRDWWEVEMEKRWPLLNLFTDAPSLRITGGPVTLIFDDSSDC